MQDKHSYANSSQIRITHANLDLYVSFDEKVLEGHVDLALKCVAEGTDILVLDTIKIIVYQIKDLNSNADLFYSFSDEHCFMGRKLSVKFNNPLKLDETKTIRIFYRTSPSATALQWYNPSQTLGKVHPYLFSQCESTHCRSMCPIQDTPSVKFTFDAILKIKAPLRGLMSAVLIKEEQIKGINHYHYEQKIPIPAYLLAIAAGKIVYRDLSPRCRVYCEEEAIEACAYEMEPTEKYLQAAENFLTPYEWTRYDLLVLPGSAPFGGMENPCLSFVSPTLLAGDRSLTTVVIHEITHSWIGNLVTNKTWEHFWLNEGINVYAERCLIRNIFGEKQFQIASQVGLKTLENYIKAHEIHHPFTVLIPALEGIDVDEWYSILPYEKGFCFMLYLEQLLGRDFMQDFLQTYIMKFRLQAIDSNDFYNHLVERLKIRFPNEHAEHLKTISWEKWTKFSGIFPQSPKYDLSANVEAEKNAERFIEEGRKTENWQKFDFSGLHTFQILLFFDNLLTLLEKKNIKLSQEYLDFLNNTYQWSKSNCDIRKDWFILCIRHNYTKVDNDIADFLAKVGRGKFVKPLYIELKKNGKIEFAKEIFEKNKNFYHSIIYKLVNDILYS